MRGCSSPEAFSIKTYVQKLIQISFEVFQNFPVFIRLKYICISIYIKIYLFAYLEMTILAHLIVMTCRLIISSKSDMVFATILSENFSGL